MRSFTYLNPEKVHSGSGSRAVLPAELARLGLERVVLMTTPSLVRAEGAVKEVEGLLSGRSAGRFEGCSQHSPAGSVVDAAALCSEVDADALVAFGGGSVIDTTKAVALELARVRGGEPPIQLALPTTLSAAEFTPVAGITDEAARAKGLRIDARILPRVVVLDAELTRWTPERLWLASGVKALDHALEALWSDAAHPLVDPLALGAIDRLRRWLEVSRDPARLDAREECQIAAWMSIAGMFNVGVRLSHPLGHQIGAFWDVPHGVTSCIVLPTVMRALAPETLDAQGRIASALGVEEAGSPKDTVEAAAQRLEELIASVGVATRLRETSARFEEIPEVAAHVHEELERLGRARGVAATPQLLAGLIESCW